MSNNPLVHILGVALPGGRLVVLVPTVLSSPLESLASWLHIIRHRVAYMSARHTRLDALEAIIR